MSCAFKERTLGNNQNERFLIRKTAKITVDQLLVSITAVTVEIKQYWQSNIRGLFARLIDLKPPI